MDINFDFIESIKQKAKSNKKTIVLPESNDERILNAAQIILSSKLANIILLGNQKQIQNRHPDLDLSHAEFINPENFEQRDDFINNLYELRKHKNMTLEQARDLITHDALYFGVMLVKQKLADGMVAGAINSTANVLRPALQILKTKANTKLVSGFFVMQVRDKSFGHNGVLMFADCAINQNPSSQDLAEIAISSAQSFRNLISNKPIVAMLSHSTKGSAKHADIDKVIQATQIIKDTNPDFLIDGELQADAAIIKSIGELKAKDSPVAGHANILIFPDLDAGNIAYKLLQRLGDAQAYGPITQGIAAPVNDLSRGCSVQDIVGVVAITAVQAQS